MFDPAADIIQLTPLGDRLAALMARLPPGTPEYQAAFSAHEAFQLARRVIGSSRRWVADWPASNA